MEKQLKFYQGEFQGMVHQSINRKLFRVQYREYLYGRMFDIDKVISANDEIDARYSVYGRGVSLRDIRGDITVSFVMDLHPVYTEGE